MDTLFSEENLSKTNVLGHDLFYDETKVDAEKLHSFAPLRDWLKRMTAGILSEHGAVMKSVKIRDVFPFSNGKVGFATLECDVRMLKGGELLQIPGYVVLRGYSVCVLVWTVLKEEEGGDEQMYLLMVRQARSPTGELTWESPAGTFEGDSGEGEERFKFSAAEEVMEETGIRMVLSNVVPLSSTTGGGTYSSGGLLDERFVFYSYRADPEQFLRKADTFSLGKEDEGEIITDVACVPLKDERTGRLNPLVEGDAKTLCMVALAEGRGLF